MDLRVRYAMAGRTRRRRLQRDTRNRPVQLARSRLRIVLHEEGALTLTVLGRATLPSSLPAVGTSRQ